MTPRSKPILVAFLSAAILSIGDSKADDFAVTDSKLTYRVSHLLKTVEGTSTAARGKVSCEKGRSECSFLVAVPVRSFESGNSNRDSHMLEATHGADFPLIEVRGALAKLDLVKSVVDVDVKFGGKEARYPALPIDITREGEGYAVHARLPLVLTRHSIDRPSLLGASVHDDVPVTVEIHLKK